MPSSRDAGSEQPETDIAGQFGARLRIWRRLNGMKQAALAQMLGVSQPAVARWESGQDTPSPARLKRLQDLMTSTLKDELILDRLFIARQSAVRALIAYDGLRLIAVSAGFQTIWPACSTLVDIPMADRVVNEASRLVYDRELRNGIRDGSLGLVSGVSSRHLDLQFDTTVHHRWHACFRRHGGQILADVVYEPCAPTLPACIDDLLYIDDIRA